MSDILKRLTSKYDITPEDESVYPDGEPRNWVANKLNPYIGDLIPKVSVADRKRGLNDMLDPEQAAMNFGMGGIANTSKFGALARKFGGANMAVPKLEEGLSKRISQAFKEMKHDPTNPEVKEAYDALIKEVTEQYDDLVKNGLKVDKIKGENPYKTSKDLHEKVNKSNSMEYFPTEQGFGAGKTL